LNQENEGTQCSADISELKTFVAHGTSYAAKPGETDDLVMGTVLLAIRMMQLLQNYHNSNGFPDERPRRHNNPANAVHCHTALRLHSGKYNTMAQNTPGKQLFDLLVTRGYDPEMLDSSGKPAATAEDAEIYSFEFITSNGTNHGTVVIMLGDDNELELSAVTMWVAAWTAKTKTEWYEFLDTN
jgi:hypothetical protein